MGELILIGTILLFIVVVNVIAVLIAMSIKDKGENNLKENDHGKDL